MPSNDFDEPTDETKQNSEPEDDADKDSDSESDSDSEGESSSDEEESGESKTKRERSFESTFTRPQDLFPDETDESAEANIKRFQLLLNDKRVKRRMERQEEERYITPEERYDFPKDRENWREEDLKELWGDAPVKATKPGWDPNWADEEDWNIVNEELKAGGDPPYAPFYIPYRKYYPVIPNNRGDISTPKAVLAELERIEEFLKWVSYIFEDGSSYEGTVWDDLAHGKGVYVAEQGMVRYEGEWLQNNMEGHGVVEVDIPDIEPVPGSKLEEQMRAEGKIFRRDFMSPEDREWLEMDIEDSMRLINGNYIVPFYEDEEWVKVFGMKPEKGRYRYAGQWKHGRMHGCGVYEFDEQPIYGRFYFGELMDDPYGCDENISTMHAGIAEVAAAKARMFINKPDGMVREERGPYNDPQHPYFYEEEDVWMAPGFINQFYEAPDLWKTYVNEVDKEREMWLNSFYKAPLRLPMPAELEHWWSQDEDPEFVVINKEPDPNDPTKLVDSEDPVILHTPSGRIINYVEDEEHGIRLFWQPPLKDGEQLDPKKAKFLPLGYDEFFGDTDKEKETLLKRVITKVQNTIKPAFDKLEKWTEEKKKESEHRIELLKAEMDLVEAEICLEEVIEDLSAELEREEREEEEKAEKGIGEEGVSLPGDLEEKTIAEAEDELEEEEGDEDDGEIPDSSFGSIDTDQDGKKPGKSPFASCSLSFASYCLWSKAPPKQQQSYSPRKVRHLPPFDADSIVPSDTVDSVSFPLVLGHTRGLRAACNQSCRRSHSRKKRVSEFHSLSRLLSVDLKKSTGEQASGIRRNWLKAAPESDLDTILSLNLPVPVSSHFLPHFSPHP